VRPAGKEKAKSGTEEGPQDEGTDTLTSLNQDVAGWGRRMATGKGAMACSNGARHSPNRHPAV